MPNIFFDLVVSPRASASVSKSAFEFLFLLFSFFSFFPFTEQKDGQKKEIRPTDKCLCPRIYLNVSPLH